METLVLIMCLPILIPLWLIYLIIMVTYKPKRGRKRKFYDSVLYHHYNNYYYDIDSLDSSELLDHLEDGICSKSDLDLLMEDDDIRDELFDDF